jgi:hypothetical protein
MQAALDYAGGVVLASLMIGLLFLIAAVLQ